MKPSALPPTDLAASPSPLHRAGQALLFLHLLLSPLVFSAQTVEVFEYNKVAILTITAILLVAGATAIALGRGVRGEPIWPGSGPGEWARRLLREPVALGFALFFFSAVCSTVVSINRRTSFFGAHESFAGLITMTAYLALFLGTRALYRRLPEWRILLFATAIAVAGAGIYGFMQLTGLDPIRWGRTSGYGGITRVFATMGHPNFYSAFLVMGFPIVLYFAWRAFREGLTLVGAALVATALLDGFMVLISISRGAWVAMGAVVAVLTVGWAFATGQKRLILWVLGITVAGLVLGAAVLTLFPDGQQVLDSIRQRAMRMTDLSAVTSESRGFIWAAAIDMFKDHPVTGVGLDGFQLAFEQYRVPEYWLVEWNGTPTKAHNEALHILGTQGALGAIATLIMTAGIGVAFVRAWRRGVADRPLLVAVLAGAVGFYVQNVFSFTVAGCGTLFVTFAAFLSRVGESSAPEPAAAAPAPARPRAPGSIERRALALGLQAGVLVLAVVAIKLAVVRPFDANSLCRTGASYMTVAPQKAVDFLNEAVATDPTKELYWVRLGTANQVAARMSTDPFHRRDYLKAARAAYQRSIDLVPENSYNWANLGRLLGDMAKEAPPLASKDECYAAFRTALEIDPNNAYFYSDAANAALGFGDTALTRDWAARNAARYKSYGPPHSQLGYLALMNAQTFAAQGRPAESSASFEEAVRLLQASLAMEWQGDAQGAAIAGSNLAAAFIRVGRYAEALEAARRALAVLPDYQDAHFNAAKAHEMLGQFFEAHAAYAKVLQLNSSHALAREALKALRKRMAELGLKLPDLPPTVKAALGD